jgi:hypothetical protein
MSKPISNECFTVIRCRDYRYTLQGFLNFTVIRCRDYRYTLQRLPLYVAGFIREKSRGRSYETL